MPTAEVTHRDGKVVDYCMVNDLPGLIWVANLASLELHALLSRSMSPTATGIRWKTSPTRNFPGSGSRIFLVNRF